MSIVKDNITVDGFRFIGSLHTVARQLFICSEIVRILGNRQLPKEILSELMTRWSFEEEQKNEIYKKSKGKLTENSRKTTAFTYYLDLCTSLKLVTNINSFYSCSRLSHILIDFLKKGENESIQLAEKLFYFFQLIILDADGILYIMQQLNEKSLNQIELQKKFKDCFNDRLIAKQNVASPIVKKTISEKYRVINFVWKKPEKYAEHLLIPRCEWLYSLDILKIEKQGNFTQYSITEKGTLFFNQIPIISTSNIKDITEEWIFRNLFTVFGKVYANSDRRKFSDMNIRDKEMVLGSSIEKAQNVVKTSNSFKLPVIDTFLYVCIDLFCNKSIAINFSEISALLEQGVVYQNRIYTAKIEGRINEGYIIINLAQ